MLDLYKRSLAQPREAIESTSLIFAGSFAGPKASSGYGAGVGTNNLGRSSRAPAIVVACEASLADFMLAGKLPPNFTAASANSGTSNDSSAMLPQEPNFGSAQLGNGAFREGLAGASAGSSPLQTRTFSFSELPELIERLTSCGRIFPPSSTSSSNPPGKEASDNNGSNSSSLNEVCWLQCVGGEAALAAMCNLGLPLHSVARRQFKDESPQVS